MPIGYLKDILEDCPKGKDLLGLDVGKKTIGLAVGSVQLRVATPLKTIQRVKFTLDIQELSKVIKQYDVGGFVIGLPLNMDGSEGRSVQSVQDFAKEMLHYPDIFGVDPWIAYWDERLSTASVKEFVDGTVEKRKTRVESKSSGLIDKLAAQKILQSALDYIA